MEDTNIILTKEKNGHEIEMVVMSEDQQHWQIIIQCCTCNIHLHTETDEIGKETINFAGQEVDLHASGITEGWVDGLGFELQD